MWLFTEEGCFYSAVTDWDDENVKWIRSRDLRSSELLADWLEDVRGESVEILSYEDADYAYRVRVSRDEWTRYVSEVADESQATNFKSEVGRSDASSEFVKALHDIWSIMYGYQARTERLRKGGSSSASVFTSYTTPSLTSDDEWEEWTEFDAWLERQK